jgi:H+/Cl- antiporter ClcA
MELAWLLPLMMLGYLIGQLELRLTQGLTALINKWFTHKVACLALGGIAIYLASLWLPAINFSGMANFHLLATSWQQQSIGFLVGSALLKLILLVICLNTGWIGGDIFPVLFCATAQGIAISQLLPHLNMVFVVGVIAISMGGTILESPLVAGGVMGIMFLPPNMLIVSALVTAILVVAERVAFPRMALLGDQLRQQLLPSNYEN